MEQSLVFAEQKVSFEFHYSKHFLLKNEFLWKLRRLILVSNLSICVTDI